CAGVCTGPIVIGIIRGGQAAYRAYRAWKLAQAMQNEIGDDDAPQEDDAETGDTTESAAEQCPDLSGKTRDEARKELEKLGFKDNGTSPGGYEKWYHPDGSRVYIKPDNSISRTGPKIKNPDPNKRGYRPRIGPDGKPTSSHNTGETVVD
ncbi:PASTA domain-containing protein, partial [Candidatus Marithioploca araucensis]|nr:PASTA domain-containing protein [Candidatus Marithioploca araucensis]